MSLFVIGDLHLSFGVQNKPMDIFCGWQNHTQLLEQHWLACVKPDDTIVLAGDFSWGMTLADALPDFQWVHRLPGRKILLKGNHDYWWTTMTKMQSFLDAHDLQSVHFLHNNHYAYEHYGICGTRGWVNMEPNEPANAKVNAREAQRLDVSLCAAEREGLTPIAFLHYPPIFANHCNFELLEVLWKHQVQQCYYGHLHGMSSHAYAINGERDGVQYRLVSGDFVKFKPVQIL